MIQRIQSLILLFSALCSLIIVFYFPVLQNGDIYVFLKKTLSYARLCVFLSVGLNIFSIFQFRNRNRQIIINQISKLFLSFAFIIIIFQRGELNFTIGLFLFIIPYLLIILANYLIRKDEKLVKSADRIR
tara:strand:- start:1340 stop:1729 length:390 start_codon:yes stop_codon:yes gene_type:complete